MEKLVSHYEFGDVKAAILLTNACTDTEWFGSAIRSCASICFVKGRIRLLLPNGAPMETPPVGQMFAYFGRAVDRFEKAFCAPRAH